MNTFYKILLAAVIVFVLLRTTGVITISWWWLFGPLLGMLVAIVDIVLIVDYATKDEPEDAGF